MKKVKTVDGYDILVDDDKFDEINMYEWKTRVTHNGRRYAYRMVNLAREIIGLEDKKLVVDHINGNSLDNRIENLREATRSENTWNSVRKTKNRTGYTGVTSTRNKWVATIKNNGKKIHVGTFKTPEEASCARESIAKTLRGEFYKSYFS
jgi:hypothetical protein